MGERRRRRESELRTQETRGPVKSQSPSTRCSCSLATYILTKIKIWSSSKGTWGKGMARVEQGMQGSAHLKQGEGVSCEEVEGKEQEARFEYWRPL